MARKKAKIETAEASLAYAIRQCIDSGRVEFGTNRTVKKALAGKAKAVIFANNCPKEIMEDAVRFCRLSNVPTITYEGSSIELGTAAGRPHPVAMLAVFDPGNSKILEFIK